MEIFDDFGNLLGLYVSKDSFEDGKKFLTKNESEFQVGVFKLDQGEEIISHIHKDQNRNIVKTSEAITVISGKLKVNFFDINQKYLRSIEVSSGESIILVSGGHGIEIIEDSKFIEIKQGPYKEEADKIRFYDKSL